MKFCPVVPEICRGQVHGARKERRITRTRTRYDYNLTIMEVSQTGHSHYQPTYQILMISDNVECLPPHFYAVFWQPF